jgi:hypothetical protein
MTRTLLVTASVAAGTDLATDACGLKGADYTLSPDGGTIIVTCPR